MDAVHPRGKAGSQRVCVLAADPRRILTAQALVNRDSLLSRPFGFDPLRII